MIAMRFRVTGRVQGVGFRWSAQEEAQALRVAGWVRNEDDGSVSGLVQGEEAEVRRFVSWLDGGPSGARVTRVETEAAEPTGLRIFTIR